jgi:hypothetical protein
VWGLNKNPLMYLRELQGPCLNISIGAWPARGGGSPSQCKCVGIVNMERGSVAKNCHHVLDVRSRSIVVVHV